MLSCLERLPGPRHLSHAHGGNCGLDYTCLGENPELPFQGKILALDNHPQEGDGVLRTVSHFSQKDLCPPSSGSIYSFVHLFLSMLVV